MSAHFDMLFPHFHIKNRIQNLQPGQRPVSMRGEMIVVNRERNTVWDFIITLYVTRLPDIQHKKVFNALQIFSFDVDLHRPKKARGNEKDKLAFFGLCKSTSKENTSLPGQLRYFNSFTNNHSLPP